MILRLQQCGNAIAVLSNCLHTRSYIRIFIYTRRYTYVGTNMCACVSCQLGFCVVLCWVVVYIKVHFHSAHTHKQRRVWRMHVCESMSTSVCVRVCEWISLWYVRRQRRKVEAKWKLPPLLPLPSLSLRKLKLNSNYGMARLGWLWLLGGCMMFSAEAVAVIVTVAVAALFNIFVYFSVVLVAVAVSALMPLPLWVLAWAFGHVVVVNVILLLLPLLSCVVVAAAFAVPGTFWLLLLARRPLRVRSVLFYATNWLTACLPARRMLLLLLLPWRSNSNGNLSLSSAAAAQQQSSDAALSLCEFRLETFLPFASLLLSLPLPLSLPLLTALWLLFIYFLLCQLIFLAPKKNCICPIAKSNSAPILIRQANSNFDWRSAAPTPTLTPTSTPTLTSSAGSGQMATDGDGDAAHSKRGAAWIWTWTNFSAFVCCALLFLLLLYSANAIDACVAASSSASASSRRRSRPFSVPHMITLYWPERIANGFSEGFPLQV